MSDDKKKKIPDYVFYLYEVKRKKFYPISNGFTIGRSASDLTYDSDRLLSRSHAEFFIDGETAIIRDLDTTNGIKVNGEKIQECELNHNDYIRLGHQLYVFSITDNENDLELKKIASDFTQENLELANVKKDEAQYFRGEKQRLISLFRNNLKTPLRIKVRSKLYFIVLGLCIVFKIGLILKGEGDLFYSKLNQIITSVVDIFVTYYVTSVFFFTFRDIFNQNNWLIFNPMKKLRIALLIVTAPMFFALVGVFISDFTGTTRIEKTNYLDTVCRAQVNVYACLRSFKSIVNDELIMEDNHHYKLFKALTAEIRRILEEKYDATESNLKSLDILNAKFEEAVIFKKKTAMFKHFDIVKKYFLKLRNDVRRMRRSVKCGEGLTHKYYRDVENNDEYLVFCEDKRGVKQGILKKFDKSSRILSSSFIENGEFSGKTIFYYSNGNKRMEVDYKDGHLYDEGFVIKWDRQGNETFNGIHENQGAKFYNEHVKKVIKKCISNDYDEKKKSMKCINNQLEKIWLKTHEIEFEKLRPEIVKEADKLLNKLKKTTNSKDNNELVCGDGCHLVTKKIKGGLVEKACENLDGRRNGFYGVYYANGTPQIIGSYINGFSVGVFKHYYPNGIVAIEGNIYNNKWVGFATVKDPQGKITFVGEFPKDVPDIKKIVKEEISKCDQVISGQPNNDPPKLRMRKCIAPVIRLYSVKKHPGITQMLKEAMRLEIAKYSNKTKIGDIKCSEKTKLDKSEELFYKCVNNKGITHGPYIIFYDNFVPKEVGLYHNGKKNGPFRRYHPNGKLAQSSRYFNDEPIGVSTRWDKDSRLIVKIHPDDKFQESSINYYQSGINQCAGSKKDICIDRFVNLYCNKSNELDCARILEAQSYINLEKMEQDNQ